MSNVIRLNGRRTSGANGKQAAPARAASPASGVKAQGKDATKPKARAATERVADAAAQPRARREPPARSRPHRSISNVFRSAKVAKEADPGSSAKNAVHNAVESAYRVVDEYLKWGRDAASEREGGAPQRETWGGNMGRHPFAMMGMYNPVAKWWYDAAYYWMGMAAPWYGAVVAPPCDERERYRRDGCYDDYSCGTRSCGHDHGHKHHGHGHKHHGRGHGPHGQGHHGHGHEYEREAPKETSCDASPDEGIEESGTVSIHCTEPTLVAGIAFTLYKLPKRLEKPHFVGPREIQLKVSLNDNRLAVTVSNHPHPGQYDVVLLDGSAPVISLKITIARVGDKGSEKTPAP